MYINIYIYMCVYPCVDVRDLSWWGAGKRLHNAHPYRVVFGGVLSVCNMHGMAAVGLLVTESV